MKIFPLPGSAVPPTAYEWGGGYYGYDEQADFLKQSLMVAGLDEVMDWPAVWNPENPSHKRLWGMIQATFEKRGVVEGHGAGLRDLNSINAFAAAGLASDHEGWTAEEVWDKLRHGIFIEIRPHSMPEIIAGLLERGLTDWSQVAFATDDRSASDTLKMGATDHNVRLAIQSGLTPEIAIQCVTINPARHMRLTPWVGSIAPGRFADIVLLDDVEKLSIAEVWADGQPVSKGTEYHRPPARHRLAGLGLEDREHQAPDRARGFRHCRRDRPRDHAGGFAAAVPLARRLHHHGASRRERRGAARSGPERHQVRHRRPLLRRGAKSPGCSGSAAARRRRIRRSAARSRTTSTISGSSARPTRPWRWWRTASRRSAAAGFWSAAARCWPRCATRSAG